MKDMIGDVVTNKPLAKNRHQVSTKAMGLEAFGYLHSGFVKGRELDCLS